MKIRPVIRGLISYIPLIKNVLKSTGTGGSSSSEYCYSVWMRHLQHLESCGMNKMPSVVGELGPGDSLGIGIAALLSGADKYYALDIVRHTEIKKNNAVLDELIKLFQSKSLIPDGKGFELVNPKIVTNNLPNLLKSSITSINKNSERIENIRSELNGSQGLRDITIKYMVPWQNFAVIKHECDLIFSQAVMEHVIEIDDAYIGMYDWLKPGGYISHQIDFKAHETHNTWFGHYNYSDFMWKVIMHGRKYAINRLPLSAHINSINKCNFNILKVLPVHTNIIPEINFKKKTTSYFTEEDLITTSALIIARK